MFLLLKLIIFVPLFLALISALSNDKTKEQLLANREYVRPRIVGGMSSLVSEFPWMASLQYLSFHFCGGTLINDQWILTAAHCVDQEKYKMAKIVLGEYRLKEDDQTEQEFDVEKIIVHENWSPEEIINDIALVKLSKKADINSNVKPFNLPKNDLIINAGLECIASGWGRTQVDDIESMADVLQKVKLDVYDQEKCVNLYRDVLPIHSGNICAGGRVGEGICFGDSGGPLQCRIDNVWTFIGLSSWTKRCASESDPSVFTRLTQYTDWVSNKLGENSGGK